MNYIIQLGTDTEWIYPYKKVQVPSYVEKHTTKNNLYISRHIQDALRFDNRGDADKFMKSDTVFLGIEEINNAKKNIGKPIYEPQIIEL